jgi:hypothetical protein
MDQDLINKVINRTFGMIAFWHLEIDEQCAARDLPNNLLAYQVICELPKKYKFNFCVSKEVANLLSMDINQELLSNDKDQIDDCIKEILNIFAGEYCEQIFSKNKIFNLTIPKLVDVRSVTGELLKFKADEGEFWVAVH